VILVALIVTRSRATEAAGMADAASLSLTLTGLTTVMLV